MSDQISLEGLSKAKVLAALYNASRPQGMGFLHYDPAPMEEAEAQDLLTRNTYFDYLKGRVMKVDLSDDTMDPWLYDRDNGDGSAAAVIEAVRCGDSVVEVITSAIHEAGKLDAVGQVREAMEEESVRTMGGGFVTFRLGAKGVADKLGPAVDRAMGKE